MKTKQGQLFATLLILCVVSLCAACPSYAQSTKIIFLKDGSQLKGQLISVNNGVYTIQTQNLGQVSIQESDVLSIAAEGYTEPPKAETIGPSPLIENSADPLNSALGNMQNQAPNAQGGNQELRGQVQQLQQQFLSDPAVLEQIQSVMKDPEIMQLLSNPQLMQDIMSYDPTRIQQNENVKMLLQNPKMRDLIEKLHSQSGQQQPSLPPQ